MTSSALLFFTSTCILLEGARGGCSGRVRPFPHGHARTGCHEVHVSCYTKFGDACDYDFELPPRIGGYERVPELAGDRDPRYATYPSAPGLLALAGSGGGRLHCGSNDGSPQWKNYEDVVVCHTETAHPAPAPVPGPTAGPTAGPTYEPTAGSTPAPAASVPLGSVDVRRALDGLCASLGAGEECRAEADGIMASLLAGATAKGGGDDDDALWDDDDGGDDEEEASACGRCVDVAAAAGGPAGRHGLAAALPFLRFLAAFLLAAAVAVPAAAFVSSRFAGCEFDSNGNGNSCYVSYPRQYAPVPDVGSP